MIQWISETRNTSACVKTQLRSSNCHDANFAVTGDTGCYRYDILRCRYWRQNWHRNSTQFAPPFVDSLLGTSTFFKSICKILWIILNLDRCGRSSAVLPPAKYVHDIWQVNRVSIIMYERNNQWPKLVWQPPFLVIQWCYLHKAETRHDNKLLTCLTNIHGCIRR